MSYDDDIPMPACKVFFVGPRTSLKFVMMMAF